jgi:glycosyltransferase involved in cell wall biosynthesis
MRVLVVHNRYRTSAPSGEDVAVRNERQMLAANGVEVAAFDRCNDDIDDSTVMAQAAAAVNTIWSQRSRTELRAEIRRVRPDVVHVHNTFSMLSPSVYGACKAEGVPVVQTLHNFRLFCPGALFLRDGKPCEDCVSRSLIQSMRHRCYRGSFAASATLASMLSIHRLFGTYDDGIDCFIALTEFAREKFRTAGLASEKLVVKPNFLPAPPTAGGGGGGYALFVGRLLDGKGTQTLLSAWTHLPNVPLKIVGDGALRHGLQATARRNNLNVEFLGMQDRATVLRLVAKAEMLVVPSEWYEGFPMVIAEAFACGTPVLASRIGSLAELVEDGVCGKQFTAGNSRELADSVLLMLSDPVQLSRMRGNARAYFEANLTERQNFDQLVQIYQNAILARRVAARRAV